MGWWLVLAVFLYVVCALLLIAEVFVPSGGLISICAFGAMIGGGYLFFRHSNTAGWIGVVVAIMLIPTVLMTAYRLLPKTRFGRSVTLAPPQRQAGDAIPDTDRLKALLGAEGVVVTPLRPVGMCNIDGSRIECVAESGYVDKGLKVKVINVQSTQLTVRVMDES